jgi:hypothetical protein
LKYRWAIVADIIRELSNVSNSGIDLNETETEFALQDLAGIMDTMMMNKCGFEKALILEREKDSDFAQWVEKCLEVII